MALCRAATPSHCSSFTSTRQTRSGTIAGTGPLNLCYRNREPVRTSATFDTGVTLWLQDSGNNEDWEVSFHLDTNKGNSWSDLKVTKDSQVTSTSPLGRWIARFMGLPTSEGKPPGIHFGSTSKKDFGDQQVERVDWSSDTLYNEIQSIPLATWRAWSKARVGYYKQSELRPGAYGKWRRDGIVGAVL